MQGAPNPNQFRPSIGRRIMAGAVGLDPRAGYQEQQDILNAPYNRAMQRYDVRAKELGAGAGIEERQVANQRITSQNEATQQFREEKNREKKSKMIYETKQREDAAKMENLQNQLSERIREANMRSDDVNKRFD